MKIILAIGVGSGIGGILRYLLSQLIQTSATKVFDNFPLGTLIVNIIGCFFIGLIFGTCSKCVISDELRLIIATGLLGGFTTFSAFSNETVTMLQNGQFINAVVYIMSSIFVGLLATFAGLSICKII